MSVAAQSLMDSVTYEDRDHRWEQGNWSAYDIDFSADNEGWDSLSDVQRRLADVDLLGCSSHVSTGSPTPSPPCTSPPPRPRQQQYFLATQQVDEVRHSVFFHRFFKEVIGVGGETIQHYPLLHPAAVKLGSPRYLRPPRRATADQRRRDRSIPKYAQAITLYHLIVEGSLAQPGQHFIEDFFSSEESLPVRGSRYRAKSPVPSSATSGSGSKPLRAARRGEPRLGGRIGRRWSSCCGASPSPSDWAVFTPPGMNRSIHRV